MKNILLIALCTVFCLSSCSKKNNPSPGPGSGSGNGYAVSGNIFFDWATEGILKINLSTGVGSTVLPDNNSRNGWDISRDGKKILKSTEDNDAFSDANVYTYSNLSDGSVISQFKYYPSPDNTITYGSISPDETMIAVYPTNDDGIVILNMQGKILHNLTGYAGKKFDNHTHIEWMPDNSLLFTIDESIYRTTTDYSQATLIKTLNFDSWGDISVSLDGKKIAFDGGNHIWMMNSDGSGLIQVTESDQQEKVSAFSPDGKYLLVGTDFQITGTFGRLWYLAIIPADGQKYNVNKGADKKVIFINDIKNGGRQACSGNMEWR